MRFVPSFKINWIESKSWDTVLLFSGLWLSVLFFVSLATGLVAPYFKIVDILIAIVGPIHLLTPVYLAWRADLFQTIRSENKKAFVFYPIAFILLNTLILSITFFGPDSHLGLFTIIFGLTSFVYFVWVQWHIAMQQFGVLSLYAIAGKIVARRKVDLYFCLVTTALLLPLMWLSKHMNFSFVIRYIPDLSHTAMQTIVLYVSLIVTLGFFINEFLKVKSLPRLLFMLSVCLQPILVYFYPYAMFKLIYLLPHWFVEILFLNKLEVRPRRTTIKSKLIFLLLFVLASQAVSLIFGKALLYNWAYGIKLDEYMTTDRKPFTFLALAVYTNFTFMHLYISAYLFKFSEKKTQQTVLPLLLDKAIK